MYFRYGSHDKTFEVPAKGTIVVTDDSGAEIFKHSVEVGDIWRMCHPKPGQCDTPELGIWRMCQPEPGQCDIPELDIWRMS